MFSSSQSNPRTLINPIENLRVTLKNKIRQRRSKNLTELNEMSIEEWSNISPQVYKRLISLNEKRLRAVIKNKGLATKY